MNLDRNVFMTYTFIDTHTHLDGEEFDNDRDEVVERARQAGVSRVFIPAIDLKSVETVLATCRRYKGYARPMIGLHPEEVKDDWQQVLAGMKHYLDHKEHGFIAILAAVRSRLANLLEGAFDGRTAAGASFLGWFWF